MADAAQPEPAMLATQSPVSVTLDQPIVVDQAPPGEKRWGPWRMPKVFRLPDGGIGLTFAVGQDVFHEQGKASPLFVSRDDGRSWRREEPPHPRMRAMNPLIVPVGGGEYWCLPAGNGLPIDPARMPKPLAEEGRMSANAFLLYDLEACPADVVAWMKDLPAVRWTPATRTWTEERTRWDHRGQVVYAMDETHEKDAPHRWWAQKSYVEVPPVVAGDELLHIDYWTLRRAASGGLPQMWTCSLLASTDRGRSWTVRGDVVPGITTEVSEPALAMTRDGDLVAVIRRDPIQPMLVARSSDRGRTWSAPQALYDRGVFPNLLQLDNGVLVVSYGRPGVFVGFSVDGGRTWSQPQPIVDAEVGANPGQHSCGYTGMLAVGPDEFLLAYGDFQLPDASGAHCRSILVQRIRVTPTR